MAHSWSCDLSWSLLIVRRGIEFVHESRTEPWGQTLARFLSPEGLLIGLSYAPWLHEKIVK